MVYVKLKNNEQAWLWSEHDVERLQEHGILYQWGSTTFGIKGGGAQWAILNSFMQKLSLT